MLAANTSAPPGLGPRPVAASRAATCGRAAASLSNVSTDFPAQFTELRFGSTDEKARPINQPGQSRKRMKHLLGRALCANSFKLMMIRRNQQKGILDFFRPGSLREAPDPARRLERQ
jgi:hypothetical protein